MSPRLPTDPVEERAADFAHVLLDLRRGAVAVPPRSCRQLTAPLCPPIGKCRPFCNRGRSRDRIWNRDNESTVRLKWTPRATLDRRACRTPHRRRPMEARTAETWRLGAVRTRARPSGLSGYIAGTLEGPGTSDRVHWRSVSVRDRTNADRKLGRPKRARGKSPSCMS